MTDKGRQAAFWLLVAWAVGLSVAAGWHNSATNDEPAQVFAAAAAFRGRGLWVAEHPPLYKLVAGLPLQFLPISLPSLQLSEVAPHYPGTIHRFLHENRLANLTILRAARLGMVIFLPFLLLGTRRLGELAGGSPLGLAATLAVAGQPLVLGHSFLVHTDVAAAACWVWAIVWAERGLRGESQAFLPLGLCLGLALAAKHSGVLLALFLALRLLWARLRGCRLPLGLTLAAVVVACAVPWLLTAWTLRAVTVEEERTLIGLVAARFIGWDQVREGLLWLGGLSKAVAHWFLGLAYVAWTNTHGQGINFFCGQTSPEGFFFYFPLALVAKLSAPLTLLWLAGLFCWRRLSLVARWGLLYAGLYLFASLGSNYNIGARHLMPLVPLLAVVAGEVLASLAPRLQALAAAALLASPLVSFPSYIAHFSLLVGGPRGGERLLSDSNLDWGQDWARVAAVARERGWSPLVAVYIGADDPAAYGTPMEDPFLAGQIPKHGFVAVSSFAARVGPASLEYRSAGREAAFLRHLLAQVERCGLLARVGHSISVYRCGDPPPALQQPPGPTPSPSGSEGCLPTSPPGGESPGPRRPL